jgi:CMP/dCMP kinase
VSRKPVVAIDGPAGAGKSTVTKRVADELGYLLVDTGALYRTVALAAQRAGVSWDDSDALGKFAQVLVNERAVELAYHKASGLSVKLRGDDVSLAIRAPDVSQGASKVSAVPAVRDALLDMQRQAGAVGGAVLEGRDIGTVVFPDAEAKFYLTANVEIRARRRFDELLTRGGTPDLAEVQREVLERDFRDSNRPIAPLKQASDARVIDSTALSIDQVVARIVQRVREVEAELGARA